MPAQPTSSSSRRERAAAARAEAARQGRHRRRLTIAGATVAVLALAGGITALAVAGHGKSTPSTTPAGAARTTPPPWDAPAPVLVPALVQAAGLPVLGAEMLGVHFHAHLDVIVNGRPVVVPMNIGIGASGLSPLHTHDPTGIVHIESGGAAQFTLGQFFTEWNVRLISSCLGGLCADSSHQLTVFTDGKPDIGDPQAITLGAHQEIAIEYGPRGQLPAPPSSYPFPAGL